jgi:hypothetical protein
LAAFQIELSGPAKFMIFPAQIPALGGIFEDLYSPGDTADARNGPPEGDLLEMDLHQRGQPMRHFVWKAYFRSGGRIRLVRKPEPAASYTRAYFFLPFGDDEPGATLARMLLDGKLDGEKWWFSTPGSARLMGPQDREAALLSLSATSGWQGDVAAETRRFGSMAKSNFAGSGGAVVIASHSVSREEEWTAKLRLAMNELASLSPTILVAVHAGAVFIPPSFLSEFGLARTVEIDLAKCLSTSMAA